MTPGTRRLGDPPEENTVAEKLNQFADEKFRKQYWEGLHPAVQTGVIVLSTMIVIRFIKGAL